MKKQILLDELKRLSALIMKAKIDNQPTGKLKAEFAKVSREYKVFWLRDFKKGQV